MSWDFSNKLSQAQIERLAILAEECGEVVQIVGKILRHGYDCCNPTVPVKQQKINRVLLEKELGDALWIICKMDDAGDIDFSIPRTSADLEARMERKENSVAPYLHHQQQKQRESNSWLKKRAAK